MLFSQQAVVGRFQIQDEFLLITLRIMYQTAELVQSLLPKARVDHVDCLALAQTNKTLFPCMT